MKVSQQSLIKPLPEPHSGSMTAPNLLTLCSEYGPLIRIAPDEVSASDPKDIAVIYPVQKPLEKTDWYLTYRPVALGGIDAFTDDNEKHHSATRKVVGPAYTLSSMLKNETALDDVVDLFMKKLGEFADSKVAFDLGEWLEMFSFDGVGTVFFGNAFGFIKESIDYGGYINAVHTAMPLNSVVAMAPLWFRPVILYCGIAIPKVFKAIMAADGIRKTAVRETEIAQARTQDTTSKRNDILSQILSIKNTKPDSLTINDVHVEMWGAVIAGSDSTSGALRAIFYYLMKTPNTFEKLADEIDAAFANETLRHPIGMNAMAVQYDKEVFGEDAHAFRPERWLESEEKSRAMDRAMLVFGAGTRTCIGKHLSNAEMYKVVPEIVHRFTVKMAHDQPWTTCNATFIMQSNVICKLEQRMKA
ncbi:Cytochrome P450 monooxygenase acrts1 [Didymella sp. IMI 355093]|nr:Cytochrome P450 monooxygenase acrts1 [Didymella sp. IMI 355093]